MKFIKSAVFPKDYPPADKPEVAIAGRSNAGKSSFINALTGKAPVAKVSQTPGKTRLLNFFDFGQHYRLVDTPGYGYAARSGDEMREWTQMIEEYLMNRENLAGLVLLMDIRREWEEEEEMLKRFLTKMDIPGIVLLTKVDRCSNSEKADFIRKRKKEASMDLMFPISSTKKEGVKEAEDYIFKEWIKPYLQKGPQ